jgi:hypothetical protein
VLSRVDIILGIASRDLNSIDYGNFNVNLPVVDLYKMTVLLQMVVCFGAVINKHKQTLAPRQGYEPTIVCVIGQKRLPQMALANKVDLLVCNT